MDSRIPEKFRGNRKAEVLSGVARNLRQGVRKVVLSLPFSPILSPSLPFTALPPLLLSTLLPLPPLLFLSLISRPFP